MHNAASDQALDPRRKEARPERTINRGDKDGAPFRFFNGVKYRPVKRYDAFILGSIQVREGKPKKKAKKRS